MRVLIIGEFSSFAKNLSKGIRELGHECFVFSWSDGFKVIEQDGDNYSVAINLPCKLPYPINSVMYRCLSYYSYRKLKEKVRQMSKGEKYDAVLIINPCFLKSTFWQCAFTKEMVLSLVKHPKNIFLSACGGDVPYVEYWNSQNWKNKKHVENLKKTYLTKASFKHYIYYSSFINKVIPVMYDYAEAWRKSHRTIDWTICPTIPLPVDTSKYIPHNELKGKVVVFHGIIRPEAKGTKYIVEAMERIMEKYPDKVECFAKGGMPLNDYLVLLDRTNVLIDQTYAASTGMNALYSLAMGKVLLGGNEPENAIEYQYPNIPVINIGPDSSQIYNELEKIVINPRMIDEMSEKCREYVEKVHDSKVVAKRYIETFREYGIGL